MTRLASFCNDPDWLDRRLIGQIQPLVENGLRKRTLSLAKSRFRVAQLGIATPGCSKLLQGHDRHAEPFAVRLSSPAARDRWLIWLQGRESGDCRLRWIAPASPPVEILPPPADGLFGVASR